MSINIRDDLDAIFLALHQQRQWQSQQFASLGQLVTAVQELAAENPNPTPLSASLVPPSTVCSYPSVVELRITQARERKDRGGSGPPPRPAPVTAAAATAPASNPPPSHSAVKPEPSSRSPSPPPFQWPKRKRGRPRKTDPRYRKW